VGWALRTACRVFTDSEKRWFAWFGFWGLPTALPGRGDWEILACRAFAQGFSVVAPPFLFLTGWSRVRITGGSLLAGLEGAEAKKKRNLRVVGVAWLIQQSVAVM